MLSIHDVLSLPNPPLDSSAVTWGQNTFGKGWKDVQDWEPWTDFTFENLTSMYSQVLDAPWIGIQPTDDVSAFDRVIRDELSFVLFLAKYIWPSINFALKQATVILGLGQNTIYLGPGTWCCGRKVPDWSLVSELTGVSRAKFDNLLPGDAKLSAKWKPEMKTSPVARLQRQWRLPVSQVATYANQSHCRYGYIITDAALVVLRFTKEHIDDGLSATRPTRTATQRHQSHQRTPSEETNESSQPISRPNESFGAQSYDNNDPATDINLEMRPPEYAVIYMADSGKDMLTVKFALFCLCLMASSGCGDLDCMYPPFNSWRKDQQGPGYIHNTSNLVAESLPDNAEVYETQE
ncbi:hypothetical protein E4U57_003277 [Claviceps arundinis]|uniref:Uncharacterized protein n=1 Tax=Claviceps arundinis TaxID=1623583 RepID=A0ABQ7P730_9HYPO|nr:hypothetical protein E4U57_003277 [Claviceps arundinis]